MSKYSQIVAIQIFCAANGFHQNNAENVHSVAKRDARKVQHMVFYCNVLYTSFSIDKCLVANFLLSGLTASQNSLTYLSSASTQGLNYKLKPQHTFTINRNNCDIRWAARAAETEVCFFSEFLKALFQVSLDSLSVCDC